MFLLLVCFQTRGSILSQSSRCSWACLLADNSRQRYGTTRVRRCHQPQALSQTLYHGGVPVWSGCTPYFRVWETRKPRVHFVIAHFEFSCRILSVFFYN